MTNPTRRGATMQRAILTLTLTTLLVLSGLASAQPQTARVVFARGVVTATGDLVPIPRLLRRDSRVEAGETVVTGPKALAQLVFPDHSLLYIKANSRIRIDEYRFNKEKPKDNRFSASVLRGGIRALTGLIGKRNPETVSYKTRVSTIGIRGTAVEIGERVIFDFGEGYIQNEGGITELTEGQSAITPEGDETPEVEAFQRPEQDPAMLARRFNRQTVTELLNEISGFCPALAEDAAILLLGMQDQDSAKTMAALESTVQALAECLPDRTFGRLLTAGTLLYEDVAPNLLQAGVRAGVPVPLALESVMRGMENPSRQQLTNVLVTASDLGIQAKDAQNVLRSLERNGICR